MHAPSLLEDFHYSFMFFSYFYLFVFTGENIHSFHTGGFGHITDITVAENLLALVSNEGLKVYNLVNS